MGMQILWSKNNAYIPTFVWSAQIGFLQLIKINTLHWNFIHSYSFYFRHLLYQCHFKFEHACIVLTSDRQWIFLSPFLFYYTYKEALKKKWLKWTWYLNLFTLQIGQKFLICKNPFCNTHLHAYTSKWMKL